MKHKIQELTGHKPLFKFFPEERLKNEFPWQIWFLGWIAFFKACVWISSDPNIDKAVAIVLSYKYMISMVPLIVMGIGIWNLRKWAAWGLFVICVAELIFFVIYPASLKSFSLEPSTTFLPLLLSYGVFTINGPLIDVFILLFTPIMLRHMR